MALVMKNTRTLASGRVIYRRVFPAQLRPFVPGQVREFKVSLGHEDDPKVGSRHTAALERYEAILVRARKAQVGQRPMLTPETAAEIAERLYIGRLEEDEEGRWDASAREVHDDALRQLEGQGIPVPRRWKDRSASRWGEKVRETVAGDLSGHKALRANGDLAGIVQLWREEAAELAAELGYLLPSDDHRSLAVLSRALNDAAIRAGEARLRRLDGEDVPTPPMPQHAAIERRPAPCAAAGIMATYEAYASAQGISAGVRREWRMALERLVAFIGHDDLSALTAGNLRDWRDALALETTSRGTLRTPRTVRNKYLTPIKATLTWAVEEQKIERNVAAGVTVRVAKPAKLREKSYTDDEASRILKAALVPVSDRVSARSAFARRWVPWLCAYTGARVNEITQLRKEDVQQQDGVWIIRITPDAGSVKTNEARTAPIHPHLLEQGFTEAVAASDDGPLFYDTTKRLEATQDSRQHKKIGERLAKWVRADVGIVDPSIKPNHAWRDTFKTRALEAGIQERIADAIQGHAPASVGQTYGHASVKALADAIQRFPRFDL